MKELIFYCITFVISAGAFAFGAARFFKKKKPMYFQLLVCAAGCFALKELSYAVTEFCGGEELPVSVALLGVFGCFFFLLSANYGQLDGIVDDGDKANKKARALAWIAPIVLGGALAFVLIMLPEVGMAIRVICGIAFLPLLPASYYNLKHLLLPIDPFGFLRATKMCNVAALCFYALNILQIAADGDWVLYVSVLLALNVVWIVLASERGMKKWGI